MTQMKRRKKNKHYCLKVNIGDPGMMEDPGVVSFSYREQLQ